MADIVHYSKVPVEAAYSCEQGSNPTFKPTGFWLSIEDGEGWKDWCEGEQWGLDRLVVSHTVELAPSANILWIKTPLEIDRFNKEYGRPSPYGSGGHYYVSWVDVAAKYQGIIIAPYQWSRRLDGDAGWYYSWDCSSGCIWDADAIQNIQLISEAA